MTNKWNKAQIEELVFWTLQNYDISACYRTKYLFFKPFIDNIDKYSLIVDIGCGAIAYSVMHGFFNVVLCDSLMQEYLKLPKDKTNLRGICFHTDSEVVENLSYKTESFDTTFFLNVLDHTEDPIKAFHEVVRVTKKGGHILFFCDIRPTPDPCHPHVTTLEFFKKLERGNDLEVLQNEVGEYAGMKTYSAILLKR